eukprot:TRINITY_DN34222_c0_g1_i1.p1 TRINITY_DN34222_c0_g1~~TRINITY_DN34222_c0_g1_i1.p1  ORF type:complete len:374 (-),score=74.56 TRINITY_DN34222_c0_g1_i1:73-1149(-)
MAVGAVASFCAGGIHARGSSGAAAACAGTPRTLATAGVAAWAPSLNRPTSASRNDGGEANVTSAGYGDASGGADGFVFEASGEYAAWRSGLDGWRDRSLRRAEAADAFEAERARAERERKEADERRALEERRAKESAARLEQRRLEAAEHSKWREDVVIARRADERARAADHQAWRVRVSKNRCAASRTASLGGAVSARHAVAATDAAVLEAVPRRFAPPPLPSSIRTAGVGVAALNMGAGTTGSATVAGAGVCAAGTPTSTTLATPRGGLLSCLAVDDGDFSVKQPPEGDVDEVQHARLLEDEAWQAAVFKNRSALRMERERRTAEASRQQVLERRAHLGIEVVGGGGSDSGWWRRP